MTDLLLSTTSPAVDVPARRRVWWRWAGALGLAHIVMMLAAFATEGVSSVEHGTSPAHVLDTYRQVPLTRLELGSYAEAMAFVVLVPALVLFARLFARTSAASVAAQSFLGLGIAYVGSTLAIGFPPLTAAVYGAHHGASAGVVTMVNDLRNYGFVLQVALIAGFTVALGIAAVLARTMTRWTGWVGILLGAVGLVATPFAHNAISLVWMVWWVGVCVLALRMRADDGPVD